MRGAYHRLLQGLLADAIAAKLCTQESVAEAVESDQTTIGKYLKGKAGPMDLDEADAMLRHVGSDLKAFVSTMGRVTPRADFDVLVHRLAAHEDFRALVTSLSAAPVDRQRDALRRLAELAPALAPPRRGGRSSGSGATAASTTAGRGQRQSARRGKTPNGSGRG